MTKYTFNPLSVCLLLITVFAAWGHGTSVWADDVGISKARLIQQNDSTYVLETDITQALVWTIKAPIFPDRFQVSELKYITQAGQIIVQVTATTSGAPLSPQDEILLPWMRNGVALTAQWIDGLVRQGLFLRSLEGVRVPVRLLMSTDLTLGELAAEHAKSGLAHLPFKGIHLLLIAVIALLVPAGALFRSLLYLFLGGACSLILVDVGIPGFELLFVDVLGVLIIFLLALAASREKDIQSYLPLLFLFGLLHGLAYAQELALLDLAREQKVQALFLFTVALDAGQLVVAVVLVALKRALSSVSWAKKAGAYAVGVLSVAVMLILFESHVLAGQTDVLGFEGQQNATQYTLPGGQNAQTGNARGRSTGARQLTTPVMSYLSVEPYEVRQEVLIEARAAVQFLGINDEGMGSVPIASQESVKEALLSLLEQVHTLSIDGAVAEPIITRADFVTLGAAGVVLRETPVIESLDQGIIGLTLVYETPDLPDDIAVDWRLFSERVPRIESSSTDPFGSTTMMLTPEENVFQWESRLSGYQVPVMEEIAVEKPPLPLISILLFLLVLGVLGFSMRRQKQVLSQPVLMAIVGVGFVCYPFLRFPMDLPFASQWTPSVERTTLVLDDVLTNVYRSFDVRDENDVYDRLALSVTGDQLTEIYLENRQSLEFENRGGARANVDEVEILQVDEVTRAEEGGFVANARWVVSGSVSHFGHTHYRRNQYHALVTFVATEGAWKIRDIELIEEQRLL